MSNIISCHNLSKSYGHNPLFSGISLGIGERQRIGIIGPNGSGKSTLLKILAGEVLPDEGNVAVKKGTRVITVAQQAHFNPEQSIEEILRSAIRSIGMNPDDHQMEIDKVIWKVGFNDPMQSAGSLSGGWRKRLSIACALVQDPELLLLDEPTNHLDLEGIVWLEGLLRSSSFSVVVISHDRYFLENVTNKTIELDRVYPGGLFAADGAYSHFLSLKADFLSGQQQQQSNLANKVRREVEWLRQGAKARTTKQQARIQSAEQLQTQLADLNSRMSKSQVDIEFNSSQRKTKKLIHLIKVSKTLGDRCILKNVDLMLNQGSKIGILGANASGKSTLLKILAQQIPLDSGTMERADKLRVVYFEQNRDSLNPTLTLKKTLAPDGDSVVFNDRSLHIVSYAKKFLFRAEQLDTPIAKLSGGEQARVLIAKLMLQPADVLLLDEPTNDLDIPTLEVLEESLTEFPGAVVLVTHDRFMLDRVSNIILALDGKGHVEDFADYAQWQASQKKQSSSEKKTASKSSESFSEKKEIPVALKKLTYKEQIELDKMEASIATLEAKLAECEKQTQDPAILAKAESLVKAYHALKETQDAIDQMFVRWADLEKRKNV